MKGKIFIVLLACACVFTTGCGRSKATTAGNDDKDINVNLTEDELFTFCSNNPNTSICNDFDDDFDSFGFDSNDNFIWVNSAGDCTCGNNNNGVIVFNNNGAVQCEANLARVVSSSRRYTYLHYNKRTRKGKTRTRVNAGVYGSSRNIRFVLFGNNDGFDDPGSCGVYRRF